MPLMNNEAFVREEDPPGLQPDDDVYFCKTTGEIFTDYEKLFERMILCNSMIWTCAVTGRSELTYQEALESERSARRHHDDFSPGLKRPLLLLSALTHRGRLLDVIEDVYRYARDKYFIGEVVDHKTTGGERESCEIVKVSRTRSSNTEGGGGPRKSSVKDSAYLYTLRSLGDNKRIVVVSEEQIRRKKVDALTRDSLKLFLKTHCHSQGPGIWAVKGKYAKMYKLADLTFEEIFIGKPPLFEKSLAKKRPSHPGASSDEDESVSDNMTLTRSNDALTKKTTKLAKDDAHGRVLDSSSGKRGRPKGSKRKANEMEVASDDDRICKRQSGENGSAADGATDPELIKYEALIKKIAEQRIIYRRKLEELRRICGITVAREDERAMRKAAEEDSRYLQDLDEDLILAAAIDETARMQAARLRNSELSRSVLADGEDRRRSRDGERKRKMDEEARKKLEAERKITEEHRKKRLEKMERRRQREAEEKRRHDWLKPRDDLDCDDLQELPKAQRVRCFDTSGYFGDVIMILEAFRAFSTAFEIEFAFPITVRSLCQCLLDSGVNVIYSDILRQLLGALFRHQYEPDSSADFDTSSTKGNGSANASSWWPLLNYGIPLRKLQLDSYTVSEVLRLHLQTSSGATPAALKARSWFAPDDDPMVEFQRRYPKLLGVLARTSVFELSPDDKLALLSLLVQQLVVCSGLGRDFIEENVEKTKAALKALRDHQAQAQRRELDIALRCAPKDADKPEEANTATPADDAEPHEIAKPPAPQKKKRLKDKDFAAIFSQSTDDISWANLGPDDLAGLRAWMGRTEAELAHQLALHRATSPTYPLGCDRIHRRYWLFRTLPGLFVEDDRFPEDSVENDRGGAECERVSDVIGAVTLNDTMRIIDGCAFEASSRTIDLGGVGDAGNMAENAANEMAKYAVGQVVKDTSNIPANDSANETVNCNASEAEVDPENKSANNSSCETAKDSASKMAEDSALDCLAVTNGSQTCTPMIELNKDCIPEAVRLTDIAIDSMSKIEEVTCNTILTNKYPDTRVEGCSESKQGGALELNTKTQADNDEKINDDDRCVSNTEAKMDPQAPIKADTQVDFRNTSDIDVKSDSESKLSSELEANAVSKTEGVHEGGRIADTLIESKGTKQNKFEIGHKDETVSNLICCKIENGLGDVSINKSSIKLKTEKGHEKAEPEENALKRNDTSESDSTSNINDVLKFDSISFKTNEGQLKNDSELDESKAFKESGNKLDESKNFMASGKDPNFVESRAEHLDPLASYWSVFTHPDDVDALISSLNPRGFRESILKTAVVKQRERILESLGECDVDALLSPAAASPGGAREVVGLLGEVATPGQMEKGLEGTMREMLLDLEERVHIGCLGTLMVPSREDWRFAVENGSYDLLQPGSMSVNQEQGSSCGVLATVRGLARVLLAVEQMIDGKFFNKPLRCDEETLQTILKNSAALAAAAAAAAAFDSSEGAPLSDPDDFDPPTTAIECWELHVRSSTSLSQLFVCLSILEASVAWDKSILNARCTICRQSDDDERMLLCDDCNRGFHTFCLRPKIHNIPEGNWYCPTCRPKPVKALASRRPQRDRWEDEEEENSLSFDFGFVRNTSATSRWDTDNLLADIADSGSEHAGCADSVPFYKKLAGKRTIKQRKTKQLNGLKTMPKLLPVEMEYPVVDSSSQSTCSSSKRKSIPSAKVKEAIQDEPSGSPLFSNKVSTSTKRTDSASARSRDTSAKKSIKHSRLSLDSGLASLDATEGERTDFLHAVEQTVCNGVAAKKEGVEKRPRVSLESSLVRKAKKARPVTADAGGEFERGYAPIKSSFRATESGLRAYEELVSELMRHDDAWPFLKPVSRRDAPDYYDVVARPMDFMSMRTKLYRFEYHAPAEIVADVRLILDNCELYNRPGTPERTAGEDLGRFLEQRLREISAAAKCAQSVQKLGVGVWN